MLILLALLLLALPESLDKVDQERLQSIAPQTLEKIETGQPLDLYDIKVMTRIGLTDEAIVDSIRMTNSTFSLTQADSEDLSQAGVSQKVIDAMSE